MGFRHNLEVRREARAVVKEAQAMLNGTVGVDRYLYWQRRPAWVYINELAHANARAVARLAGQQKFLHPSSWNYACAVLAGEMLKMVSEGRDVTELQRALVPLELDLLDHVYSDGLTPFMLVRLATQALAGAGL